MPLRKQFRPHLSQAALDPEARAAALAKAQDDYVRDWSWPPGCATLRTLPRVEGYTPAYVARIVALSLDVRRNHSKMALVGAKSGSLLPDLPANADELGKRFFAAAEDFHAGAPRVRPAAIGDYADYYATVETPALVARHTQDPAVADALFAWQRVAGANPMSLRRIAALPDDVALTEAHWQAAIGAGSFADALASGRVYAVDFTLLHGAPATRYLGRQKYLCGARAVFTTDAGALRPVAIQLEPGGSIFTPADGTAWVMARYCFQVADANVHETMEHLGSTHMVMEAVGVAGKRQLSEDHPLWKLLEPHIEGTFAINNSAKTSLIAPGGVIDQVFAARIDVAASLVRVALDRLVLQDRAPAREIAARGCTDAALPYPYRDDVTAVYGAIERFVEGYVRLYYGRDDAVSTDVELQAWVAEVGSPIGGALEGIRPVETVAGLVEWMTNIVHIGSAQHSAVNFPQFPFFSWGENLAGACWGPGPTADATDADLLALMPPWDCAILQADSVYQLSGVYYNKLGVYPTLTDERLAPVVDTFQKELAAVEQTIVAADASRLLTYPFLRPSLVPSSINI